jgi:hypothetical protein
MPFLVSPSASASNAFKHRSSTANGPHNGFIAILVRPRQRQILA